jgi:hypothetical protein
MFQKAPHQVLSISKFVRDHPAAHTTESIEPWEGRARFLSKPDRVSPVKELRGWEIVSPRNLRGDYELE